MQVVTAENISGKKILLRYDIDVALNPLEDFKLRMGLDTLKLCLEHGSKVILIGHVGRPFETAEDEKRGNPPEFSARPIYEWFQKDQGIAIEFATTLEQAQNSSSKFVLLENIRFFHGEELGPIYHAVCTSKTCDIDFARQLASLGDFYVNEAFSSYRAAVSTTVLPTLLPHAAGLRFASEVEKLTEIMNPPAGGPKKPFIAIMGGAKVEDKLPVIKVLSQKADAVLVGGKLIHEIREQQLNLPSNVLVGKLNEDGFDIAEETVSAWAGLISKAAMIVWNGPLGKAEDPKYTSTKKVIRMILDSQAEIIIGGGDSVAVLNQEGLLEEAVAKAFVSVGGGAMLKLLTDGTLPTIEALK